MTFGVLEAPKTYTPEAVARGAPKSFLSRTLQFGLLVLTCVVLLCVFIGCLVSGSWMSAVGQLVGLGLGGALLWFYTGLLVDVPWNNPAAV